MDLGVEGGVVHAVAEAQAQLVVALRAFQMKGLPVDATKWTLRAVTTRSGPRTSISTPAASTPGT
jgi:hypothetical protein